MATLCTLYPSLPYSIQAYSFDVVDNYSWPAIVFDLGTHSPTSIGYELSLKLLHQCNIAAVVCSVAHNFVWSSMYTLFQSKLGSWVNSQPDLVSCLEP